MTNYSATIAPSLSHSVNAEGGSAGMHIIAAGIVPIFATLCTCAVGVWKRSILMKCISGFSSSGSSGGITAPSAISSAASIAKIGVGSGVGQKAVIAGAAVAGTAVIANAVNNKMKDKKIEKLEKENKELRGEVDMESQEKTGKTMTDEVVVVVKESVNKGIAFSKKGSKLIKNEFDKKFSNKPPKSQHSYENQWEAHKSRLEMGGPK